MKKRANEDIRLEIETAGIKYYQVAKALKISDSSFTKQLRFELNQEQKDKIFKVIEDFKKNSVKE